VFTKINQDFPGDVGVLSLFFLNLIRLKPGQAIYLGANEIHAYLDGDCIECMACIAYFFNQKLFNNFLFSLPVG